MEPTVIDLPPAPELTAYFGDAFLLFVQFMFYGFLGGFLIALFWSGMLYPLSFFKP